MDEKTLKIKKYLEMLANGGVFLDSNPNPLWKIRPLFSKFQRELVITYTTPTTTNCLDDYRRRSSKV